jgi:hypothetical protein
MLKSTKVRLVVALALVAALWSGWRLWERISPSALNRLKAEVAGFDATGRIYPIRSLRPTEFSHLCVLGPYQSVDTVRGPYADLLSASISSVEAVADDGHIKLLLLRPDNGRMKEGRPVFTFKDMEINRSPQFDLAWSAGRDMLAIPSTDFTPMDCAAVEKAAFLRLEPGADGRQRFIFGERTVGE